MKKGRLEAFSDGVIAIIITIMVLELKVPQGDTFDSLRAILPAFLSYLISFIYVAIYWNNHHHLLHTASGINGKIMWANMHLLFWLSLTPFVTNWIGENHFSALPMALYGFVLLMDGLAYYILQQQLLQLHGKDSLLAKALGTDLKAKSSVVLYITAIIFSFITTWVSGGIYIFVALMWLVPDKRIEKAINNKELPAMFATGCGTCFQALKCYP